MQEVEDEKAENYILRKDVIIQESELKKLLKEVCEKKDLAISKGQGLHYINEYFAFEVAANTGLRVSELANLKIKDINLNLGVIYVIGKRTKIREVPFGKKLRKVLKSYLLIKEEVLGQSLKKGSHLFLSNRKAPYTRQSLYKKFKTWCDKVQINPNLRFHSLRHRFATYLLNSGFNLSEVQRIMGHGNIQTTARYLHFTEKTERKIEALL